MIFIDVSIIYRRSFTALVASFSPELFLKKYRVDGGTFFVITMQLMDAVPERLCLFFHRHPSTLGLRMSAPYRPLPLPMSRSNTQASS